MGFDINEVYVNAAKKRLKGRGEFVCAALKKYNVRGGISLNIVFETGVLNHLNNCTCNTLFRLAYKSLRQGGRLITQDVVSTPNQNLLEGFFVARGRRKLSCQVNK